MACIRVRHMLEIHCVNGGETPKAKGVRNVAGYLLHVTLLDRCLIIFEKYSVNCTLVICP